MLDRSQWQVDVGEAAELYETYYQKIKKYAINTSRKELMNDPRVKPRGFLFIR